MAQHRQKAGPRPFRGGRAALVALLAPAALAHDGAHPGADRSDQAADPVAGQASGGAVPPDDDRFQKVPLEGDDPTRPMRTSVAPDGRVVARFGSLPWTGSTSLSERVHVSSTAEVTDPGGAPRRRPASSRWRP